MGFKSKALKKLRPRPTPTGPVTGGMSSEALKAKREFEALRASWAKKAQQGKAPAEADLTPEQYMQRYGSGGPKDYGHFYGDTKGTKRGTRTNFPAKEAQARYDAEAAARIHEGRVGLRNDRGLEMAAYHRRADDPVKGFPLVTSPHASGLSEGYLKTLSPGTAKNLLKLEARHNVRHPPTRHPTGPPDTPPPSPPSSPAPQGPDVFPAPPAKGINKAPGSQEKQFADWIQTLKPEQRAELLQTMRDLKPFTPKK